MDELSQQDFHYYMYFPIKLPKTASPVQCLSVLTNRGNLTYRKILEIRPVHMEPGGTNYTAVLLDTDTGQKIVLLAPEETNSWYFQIYDAK